jgi:hypothetical protein
MQMKLDKRLSHGVNMLWAYTFSKLMDNNTTSIVNDRHYRAVSLFDQKHVMRLAFTYELPFRFHGMLLRQAAGGWAVSGFGTLASGVPLSVTQTNGRPIRLLSPKLEGSAGSRLGDKRDASGKVLNPYFNTNAFLALPDQYTISLEPPALDDLRAPGTKSLNFAVFKAFPIRERFKVEVRMEATGVTNSPIFDAPGTNMSQTATFGVITSASGNRAVQGSARLVF